MKILFISSSFPRSSTHLSASFSYEFCKNLAAKEIDVIVLAPHNYKSKFNEIINGLKVCRFPYFYPFSMEKLAYGGGFAYNFKNSILAKVQLPFFLLFELLYSIKIIKNENIDIVVSFWLIPQGLIGAICHKILRIPHIAVVHSSEVTILKKVPLSKLITEFIIVNSNSLVSVSSHRAKELLSIVSPEISKNVENKLHIIPMGINPDKFHNKKDKDHLKQSHGLKTDYVVLFVGRLVEVKGCKYLIEGFKEVVNNFSNSQLIIVGSGILEPELKNLVKRLCLEKNVKFKGFVSSDKIADYYTMADVVVVPSIVDSSGFQEGFPVVVLEALIAGKPIIATKTNGIMEIIKDNYNGILVEPKSSEQITNALLKLIIDKSLIDFLSKNTLITGKEYNWDSIIKRYMEVINSFPAQR